jgi:cytoskeletal protein CcmA (bactofilin family)
MSVFCPHCRQRLILEDYRIKTYQAVREIATCGDVIVEKKGAVAARVLAGNLTVKGKVQGNVRVQDRVEITKTGIVQGDICAPRLVVAIGAKVAGFCRIGEIRPENGHPPA